MLTRLNTSLSRFVLVLAACVAVSFLEVSLAIANQLTFEPEKTYGAEQARKVSRPTTRWVTTDHSRHPVLQQEFSSPEEVTRACLTCHNEASNQIHQTIHWTWIDPADSERLMGKNGLTLNNFCISIHSNEP